MLTVERYVISYIRRRRGIALLRALMIAVACGLLWIWVFPTLRGGSIILMLLILARPVWRLFCRYNLVLAAMQIEAAQPVFDQKLTTVVSEGNRSALMDHLRREVELMIEKEM